MNETRRKPTTGRQSPTLFDKWHGIFYMPSRIDEAGHTKAFDDPVAEHWRESQRAKRSLVAMIMKWFRMVPDSIWMVLDGVRTVLDSTRRCPDGSEKGKSVGETLCRNKCCWGFHPQHPRLEILKTLKKRVCSRKCNRRFRDSNPHLH